LGEGLPDGVSEGLPAGRQGILLTPIRSLGATLKNLRLLGFFLAPFDSRISKQKAPSRLRPPFAWGE